jgi:hypothetical protein
MNGETVTAHEPLVTAAKAITAAHLDALGPLAEIATAPVEHPPTIEGALDAVLHLHTAGPQLDHSVTRLLTRLNGGGISLCKIARLVGLRAKTLDDRIVAMAVDEDDTPVLPEITLGDFKRRDRVSTRAARESLITAARDLGRVYTDALRPISLLSQGDTPEAAVVDTALEAAVHLHRSRRSLDDALDPVLACLVLGGVKKMALAEHLGITAPTLQRRLMAQPLASARWADLVEVGDGTWTVQRAEVGRYAG